MASTNNTPSNKHFKHTLATTASPETIWAIWTDVDHWQDWDSGLQSAELKGPFTTGTKGRLIPLKGPKATFVITEYEEGKSYTFKTRLPLGGLYVKRFWEINDGKTYFTHEVTFKGLTGGLFARGMGKQFREMLPGVLEKIREIAEQQK